MLRLERMLWAMMLGSIVVFFFIAKFEPPGTSDGAALNVLLPVLAVTEVALSFIVPSLMRRGRARTPELRRTQLLIALVFCEAAVLMGFVLHTSTGWPYAWTLFLLGGVGMLLHFPRS